VGRPSRSPLGTALEVRHQAALKFVAVGELDGALALFLVVFLVVWPPKGSRLEDGRVPLGRQQYPRELREETRRRHARARRSANSPRTPASPPPRSRVGSQAPSGEGKGNRRDRRRASLETLV